MFETKTNLKCRGCQKDLPKEEFDSKTQRPTWFGTYKGWELQDWVCVDCWDKGVRYNGYKEVSR
jgi:hypothetical protein